LHYEKLVQKAQQETLQYKNRAGEMDTRYQNTRAQIQDLINQITKEKRAFGQLHEKYMQNEKQLGNLSKQISQLVSKETDLIDDRKLLRKEYLYRKGK
jgi:chromosome segregation ATPase